LTEKHLDVIISENMYTGRFLKVPLGILNSLSANNSPVLCADSFRRVYSRLLFFFYLYAARQRTLRYVSLICVRNMHQRRSGCCTEKSFHIN